MNLTAMRSETYVLAAFFAALIVIWWLDAPHAKPVGVSVALPSAKEVVGVATVKETVKVVYVYPKSVKPKLNLPESVVKDDLAKVTATAKLKTADRDYTLTSVINSETGNSLIYARLDPLPILALSHVGEASISYGIKGSDTVGRLSVSQNILQVKSIRFGVTATLDTDGDYFAGLSANYRW
jgi:hypothetical protein